MVLRILASSLKQKKKNLNVKLMWAGLFVRRTKNKLIEYEKQLFDFRSDRYLLVHNAILDPQSYYF